MKRNNITQKQRSNFFSLLFALSSLLFDLALRPLIIDCFAVLEKSCIFVERMREYLFNRKTNN